MKSVYKISYVVKDNFGCFLTKKIVTKTKDILTIALCMPLKGI